MIKLKGGDDKNSILAQTAKRMNLPTLNPSNKSNHFTSPGSHHAQQISSDSSSTIPDGPTPLASRLGMPSATSVLSSTKSNKDWSATSNRIAVGGPVFIRSKSHRDDADEEDEAALTSDQPKRKLGDAAPPADSDSDDDDFADFTTDDEARVLAALREKRLQELRASTGKQQTWLGMGHGVYTDIAEDEFLKAVTGSKYVLCHFYHAAFDTCKVVDLHLARLAGRHLPTRFIKVNAEKAPFFVQKLQVRMLPTIVAFKDGIAVDRVVGFDELGGVDDFPTEALEKRLAKAGVLLVKEEAEEKRRDGVKGSIRTGNLSKGMEEENNEGEDD